MDTMAFIIALTEMGVITEGIADAVAEYIEDHPEILEDAMDMIASPEASSTASSPHAKGSYFIYDGNLYCALADIAQGGSIVTSGSGANCEAVTVAGEVSKTNGAVSDLKSAITDYEINFATAKQISALINSSGKYSTGDGSTERSTAQISAQGIAYLAIKANPSYQCEYAFLASTMEGLSNGDNIPFVEGETGKRTLQSGAEIIIQVPAGCNYIAFLNTYSGNTYLPTYAVALKASSPAINLKSALNDVFQRRTRLTSSDNLNNITTSGIYYIQSSDDPENCPTGFVAGILNVFNGEHVSNGFIAQQIFSLSKSWYRYKTTSAWGDWHEQALSDNEYLGFSKLGVIGHSGPYGTRLSNRSDAWPYIAADILAIPNVNNVAVGGSTIAKKEDSYEEIYFSLADFEAAEKDTTKKYLVKDDPTDAHPFMIYQYSNDAWAAQYSSHIAVNGARAPVVDVVRSLDADVDIIMIGAGANDYQYGWTPFGAVNDTPTKYTFCGAVHLLLQYIMATYPGVPVTFSDAIIWNQSLYTTANSIGKTYLDYLNAMKEIARMYKIPYVDFDAISSFPYPSADATWYAEDEKHMSEKGHERVGQVVAAQIKSILG